CVTAPEKVTEDKEAKKEARETLWAEFQASASAPLAPKAAEVPKSTITVEKRYLFAGNEVSEIVEVPEDSPDAQKWPRWYPSNLVDSGMPAQSLATARTARIDPGRADPSHTHLAPQPPATRRPGPRKPKTTLSAPPPKAKKLSTLDKSAMDWNSHINAQSELDVRDELEANRRGGGYLERVEFLKRVDERKEDVIEASKPTKRRKL
ncbi:hypothetical protein HWV62_7306, partial [Athelia sp. TMB]